MQGGEDNGQCRWNGLRQGRPRGAWPKAFTGLAEMRTQHELRVPRRPASQTPYVDRSPVHASPRHSHVAGALTMRMPLPSAPTRGTRQTTVAVTDSESQHGGDSEGLRLPGRQSWVRGSPRGVRKEGRARTYKCRIKIRNCPTALPTFLDFPSSDGKENFFCLFF